MRSIVVPVGLSMGLLLAGRATGLAAPFLETAEVAATLDAVQLPPASSPPVAFGALFSWARKPEQLDSCRRLVAKGFQPVKGSNRGKLAQDGFASCAALLAFTDDDWRVCRRIRSIRSELACVEALARDRATALDCTQLSPTAYRDACWVGTAFRPGAPKRLDACGQVISRKPRWACFEAFAPSVLGRLGLAVQEAFCRRYAYGERNCGARIWREVGDLSECAQLQDPMLRRKCVDRTAENQSYPATVEDCLQAKSGHSRRRCLQNVAARASDSAMADRICPLDLEREHMCRSSFARRFRTTKPCAGLRVSWQRTSCEAQATK